MRHESKAMIGDDAGCHVKLFDYSHTAAPDSYAEHCHTVLILRPNEVKVALPERTQMPGNSLIGHEEIDTLELSGNLREHRLGARRNSLNALASIRKILMLLDRYPESDINIHDWARLALCPDQEPENVDGIEADFTPGSLLCQADCR